MRTAAHDRNELLIELEAVTASIPEELLTQHDVGELLTVLYRIRARRLPELHSGAQRPSLRLVR